MSEPFDRWSGVQAHAVMAQVSERVAAYVLTRLAGLLLPSIVEPAAPSDPVMGTGAHILALLTQLNSRTGGLVHEVCESTSSDANSHARWTTQHINRFASFLNAEVGDVALKEALEALLDERVRYSFEPFPGPISLPVPSLPGGLSTPESGKSSIPRAAPFEPIPSGFGHGQIDLPSPMAERGPRDNPFLPGGLDLDHLGEGLGSRHWSWPSSTNPVPSAAPGADDLTSSDGDGDVVSFEMYAGDDGDALVGAEAGEAMPPVPASTRVINSLVDGYDADAGLIPKQAYALTIGADLSPHAHTVGGTALSAHLDGREVPIEVNLVSEHFDIAQPKAMFTLPSAGASDRATFEIVPREPGVGAIQAVLLANGNFLQTYTITLKIGSPSVSAPPSTSPRGRQVDSAAYLGPRDIQLMVELEDNECALTYFRPLPTRARFRVSATLLDASLRRLRKALEGLIQGSNARWEAPLQDHVDLSEDDSRATLVSLARAGNQLFKDIFYPAGRNDALLTIARALIHDTATPGRVIQIIERDFPIPWALMYPAETFDETQVRWEGFLGGGHIVEQLLLQDARLVNSALIERNGPLAVSVNVNEDIDVQFNGAFVAPQLAYWKQQDQAEVAVTYRTSGAQLLAALADAHTPDQIMYLYCHAVSVNQANPADDTPSHLLFGGEDELTLQHLQYDAGVEISLACNPLVFVNACQSAQMFPTYYAGFVPYFLGKGARGVIGTECSAPALFAADWANNFFTQMLAGNAIGHAVKELRSAYWREHGNPLGLIYSVYCDCDTRIAEPAARAHS